MTQVHRPRHLYNKYSLLFGPANIPLSKALQGFTRFSPFDQSCTSGCRPLVLSSSTPCYTCSFSHIHIHRCQQQSSAVLIIHGAITKKGKRQETKGRRGGRSEKAIRESFCSSVRMGEGDERAILWSTGRRRVEGLTTFATRLNRRLQPRQSPEQAAS